MKDLNIGSLVVVKKTDTIGKIKHQLGNDSDLVNWFEVEINGNKEHYREDELKLF